MHLPYGSLLSTAFSAAMIVASAVAAPADAHMLQQPVAVIQPVREAFQDAHMKECMMERRRMLYEARSNTLIMTNMAVAAHQEVATGPRL